MVEKIDRPDAPQPYQITRPKDAKEQQHYQHNPREEMEREYKKQLEGKEWSKFGQRARTIKPLRVARETIARCLFKAVNLHSGIGIIQADVHWKDGRVTRDALMLTTRLEDFIRLKKFQQGEEIPDNIWARGPTVEIGIVQMMNEPGSFPSQEYGGHEAKPKKKAIHRRPFEWLGIVGGKPRRINWGLSLLYAFIIGLLVFAVVAMI